MKQMLLTMLLLAVTMTAAAGDKKGENLDEKFFDARVKELVYRLDITDEQKVKFVPIYRRYCDEMRATMGPRDKDVKGDKPKSDEERLTRTKQRMERQQQAQAIRIRYVDEFATVLNAGQVSRFFEVERHMQKKMMDRKNHRKDGKMGRGQDGKPRMGKHFDKKKKEKD